MRPTTLAQRLLLTTLAACGPALAGWQDMLKSAGGMVSGAPAPAGGASAQNVSQQEAGSGLREALEKGAERVVGQLGAKDGFLGNPQVRIPLPSQLSTAETALRFLGQGAYADQFVETMNRAAEKAVSEALPVLVGAIQSMSFEDALNIVRGPADSATQYLRRSSGEELQRRMLPIVKSATESTNVTAAYKALVAKAGSAGPMMGNMVGMDVSDLDGYVTDKTLDGLYRLLAEQEQGIRGNPGEWTTDTLKKVFGSIGG